MRTRAWRRNMEDIIVIRRIKRIVDHHGSWWSFIDINGIIHKSPILKDYIGTKDNHMYKTYKTCIWDSRHKVKYSPNKGKAYWRDNNKKGTREAKKIEFFKILKEYGIK